MATETVPNIARGHIPYEEAHECNDILFDVLTLLYAADGMIQADDAGKLDHEKLTSPNSRLNNLMCQARAKTAQAIKLLNI